MNVGGVPWTGQKDPSLQDGFVNVLLLCGAVLVLLMICFTFPALYTRLHSCKQTLHRNWSLNRKSFLRTLSRRGFQEGGGYTRL